MASTDARPVPQKNVAFRVTFDIKDADGDLVTGATALDSEVSKDAGTFADCTNEATEIATASGVYYLDLTATEMNADTVAVIVKTTSAGAKTTTLIMYPEEAGDIRVNATQLNGTGLTGRDIGASVLLSSGTGAGQLDFTSGVVKSNLVQILATALTETAGQIAGGFKKLFDVAAPVFDLLSIKQTGDNYARIGAAGASLTDLGGMSTTMKAQVQTEAEEAIVAKKLDKWVIQSGTLTTFGGGHSTGQIEITGLPAAADISGFYRNTGVLMLTGSNANALRKIQTDTYSGTSGQHTFTFVTDELWPYLPVDGDTFILIAVHDETMRGTNSAALASNYTATRAGYLDKLNDGTLVTAIWAAGTRTLTSFGTLTTDAAAAVWDRLTSALTTVGSIGKLLVDNVNATVSSRSSHSAADVWASGTRTLTSFGTLVADTTTAVWAALTSALTTVGSVGKLIVDNLNATISSRASQTSVDDLPTNAELATALGTADDATLAAISTLSTKVGTPAGVSVSADIAAVKSDTGTIVTNVAAILDDTGTSGVVLTVAERTAIADALLSRDMSLVAGVALNERKVLNALRTMRNKVTIVGTTLTVYKEDDTTAAYTATITTDAAALPITASDPA